jgi:hypothetical protein
MEFLYTPQQIAGYKGYYHKVKLGNWSEDQELAEARRDLSPASVFATHLLCCRRDAALSTATAKKFPRQERVRKPRDEYHGEEVCSRAPTSARNRRHVMTQ